MHLNGFLTRLIISRGQGCTEGTQYTAFSANAQTCFRVIDINLFPFRFPGFGISVDDIHVNVNGVKKGRNGTYVSGWLNGTLGLGGAKLAVHMFLPPPKGGGALGGATLSIPSLKLSNRLTLRNVTASFEEANKQVRRRHDKEEEEEREGEEERGRGMRWGFC